MKIEGGYELNWLDKLEKKYIDAVINGVSCSGIMIEPQDNEWVIESLLNKNYTE